MRSRAHHTDTPCHYCIICAPHLSVKLPYTTLLEACTLSLINSLNRYISDYSPLTQPIHFGHILLECYFPTNSPLSPLPPLRKHGTRGGGVVEPGPAGQKRPRSEDDLDHGRYTLTHAIHSHKGGGGRGGTGTTTNKQQPRDRPRIRTRTSRPLKKRRRTRKRKGRKKKNQDEGKKKRKENPTEHKRKIRKARNYSIKIRIHGTST